MTDQEIQEAVRAIIADRLDVDDAQIRPDAQLRADLGADSFAAVEIAYELENKFGIEVADDDMTDTTTVQDIVDYVVKKIRPA